MPLHHSSNGGGIKRQNGQEGEEIEFLRNCELLSVSKTQTKTFTVLATMLFADNSPCPLNPGAVSCWVALQTTLSCCYMPEK